MNAEQAVLGSIFINPDVMISVAEHCLLLTFIKSYLEPFLIF